MEIILKTFVVFVVVLAIPALILIPPFSYVRIGIAYLMFVLMILFLDGNPRKILKNKEIKEIEKPDI